MKLALLAGLVCCCLALLLFLPRTSRTSVTPLPPTAPALGTPSSGIGRGVGGDVTKRVALDAEESGPATRKEPTPEDPRSKQVAPGYPPRKLSTAEMLAQDPEFNPRGIQLSRAEIHDLNQLINDANKLYDAKMMEMMQGGREYGKRMIAEGNAIEVPQGSPFKPSKPGNAIYSGGDGTQTFGVEYNPREVPETSVPLSEGEAALTEAAEKIKAYFAAK